MEETDKPRSLGNDDLDRLLFDLVMRGGLQLEAWGDAGAVLRSGQRLVALMRHLPGREEEMRARLVDLMTQLTQRASVELLLIGGPPEAHTLLADSRPVGLRKQVLLYHRADDGSLWNPNGRLFGAAPLGAHLKKHPLVGPSGQEEREQFAAKLAEMQRRNADDARETQAFAERMNSRRPVVSWALAATIAVTFALQWLFGGTDSSPVLARMGALMPDRVQQGEWWRLLSSSFLHGGALHFGLNTWVLLMVGGNLERLLGGARMLTIYGLSALGASLVALATSDASLTVGASGGIWGLLAAEGVLVWRPRGLLPEAVRENAKQNVVVNLVINVANSFRPNVAMAAHFGGGAVGALLLAGGFLLRGLPTLTQSQADASAPRPSEPRWLRPLALASAAMLLASLVTGLVAGRAWELKSAPALERRELPGLGLSGELPVGLAQVPLEQTSPEAPTLAFGDLLHDASVVVTSVQPYTSPVRADELKAEVDQLLEQLAKPPAQATVTRKPEALTVGGRPGAIVRYGYDNGAYDESVFVLLEDEFWHVEVVSAPGFTARTNGLAERIAGSLQPLQPR